MNNDLGFGYTEFDNIIYKFIWDKIEALCPKKKYDMVTLKIKMNLIHFINDEKFIEFDAKKTTQSLKDMVKVGRLVTNLGKDVDPYDAYWLPKIM